MLTYLFVAALSSCHLFGQLWNQTTEPQRTQIATGEGLRRGMG
jgi:hypothetical protein